MKILITSDWYKSAINGVVTSVVNLINGLEDMGHEVRVLTLSGSIHSYRAGKVTYIGSIGVGRIYPNARLKMALTHRYVREIIEWGPDVVHSQCEFSTFFLAKKISQICNVPLVHTYHTVYEDYTHYFSPNVRVGKFLAASFSKRILDKTQMVIAPTKKTEHLLKEYEVKAPITTVPSGLELNKFNAFLPDVKRKMLRNKFGVSENEILLVYIGRLAKEKNIEELFRLIDELNINIKLLLVGDGPYRESLEKRSREMQIENKVIFAGMAKPEKIVQFYKIGDIFVSASQSETQGLTYIEAMAAGVPIICKKDSCLDDVVINGENGFEYTTDDEFKEALSKLIESSDYRVKIGHAAAQTVADNFSSVAFAKTMLDIYNSLINNKKKCKSNKIDIS